MAGYSSFQAKWEMLVADTWDDEQLKQRLINDPVTVLRERGIHVPKSIEIKVVEDTDDVEHLVLPSEPLEDEMSYEQLAAVAGGRGRGDSACRGCVSCYGCHASQASRGCAAASKASRGCRGCRP
jgi:Nitrile hydratase, alpha chain